MTNKTSLFHEIWNYILDVTFGKKYYFCLTYRTTVRVRPDDATQKPVPLVETSSCIFHSKEEIANYCLECTDDMQVFRDIHSFRSHIDIPNWNMYYEYKSTKNGNRSKLV